MGLSLSSRNGRLATLFFLYVTEGIPLGFTAVTLATEMRRRGLGVEQIGAFVASLYLPWAWKWALGPVIDVVASDRWGRRRGWILGAQVMMVGTLAASLAFDMRAPVEFMALTALIFVHNLFGASQDVAIDALACQVLPEDERGLANGLMFAGAYVGQAVGGSGVLYLREPLEQALGKDGALKASFALVAAAILAVTLLVVRPMREPPGPPRPHGDGPPLQAILSQLKDFVRATWRSFTSSRAARVAVLFALLPAGAMALSLSLQSNLSVELGLTDNEIATLSLWCTILSAAFCVVGGKISDRLGRRRMLAIYLALTALPTAWLAWQMHRYGWIMPAAPDVPNRPAVAAELPRALWIASLAYTVPQGLMYGTRVALFMDVTNPAVAATQFTGYMALLNVAIALSARWQGWSAEHWGYPTTLAIDAVLAVASVPLLLWMGKPANAAGPPPESIAP
ncbi:MAG: MFS transporter [Deltaproteobacteria bacterium]|nr:MFS transporter [Deltaproteobacteria bacterium]